MNEQARGRCRREIEQAFGSRVLPSSYCAIANALDRIEARLEAETTANQAARQTAERLLVSERDDWKRRADAAERELAALRERYRPRRYPDEKPEGRRVLRWFPSLSCWLESLVRDIGDGDLWCYAPPPPDTTPDAAPAATADDTPPVAGTGETTTSEEKARAWMLVRDSGAPDSVWLSIGHAYDRAERLGHVVVPLYTRPQPAPVVKLPRNPYRADGSCGFVGYDAARFQFMSALNAAGVKWEEE